MSELEAKSNIENSKVTSSLTILEIISVFFKYRRKIFVISIVVCILSVVVYFFILDKIYFSSATIKSSAKSSGLLGGLENSIPDIGGLDELGLSGGKSSKELAVYEQIITSRRCIEPLIDKFHLMDREDFLFKEDAIKNFVETKMSIKLDKISGTMAIGIYDKDPNLAREMVEFLLGELNNINVDISIQSAKSNREFIEKRYLQSKIDLAATEDTLKTFQSINGIAPDLQFKASAQAEFTLESELKLEEVKLDVLKKILNSNEIEVKTQEEKINSLRNKVAEIHTSTDVNDFLRLGNSPNILLAYFRLQRDVEIQSKIMTFLLPLYEQAKIEEKRDTPTIVVLDKPYIAERKSKPKRLTMVFIFTFMSFFFSIAFFVIWNKFSSFMRSEEYLSLKKNISK